MALKAQTRAVVKSVSVDFPELPSVPTPTVSADVGPFRDYQQGLEAWYYSLREALLEKFAAAGVATGEGTVGPAGPAGPRGATGATGSQGAAGIGNAGIDGRVALVVGDLGGSVTLTPDFEPDNLVLTVQKPADGLNIFACVTEIRADGFDYELSAAPDESGYWLSYRLSASNTGRDGQADLGDGAIAGTVSLALSFTPSQVVLTVQKPVDGLNLFACVTDVRADGFDFELSAETDSADYVLHYRIT
jgi:hypothetical protein